MVLQQHKIVFGGSMGAGKSAAIKTLSDIPVIETEAINTDINRHSKYSTTVGIDYGEIVLEDDTKIGLYGTPGQDRFDFMWPIICKGAIGVALLIDHSNQERLQELQTFINAFQGYSENIVIGITHLDQQADQVLKIYREWMALHHYNYPLFAVDARQKDDVLLLVEVLITAVETRSLEML